MKPEQDVERKPTTDTSMQLRTKSEESKIIEEQKHNSSKFKIIEEGFDVKDKKEEDKHDEHTEPIKWKEAHKNEENRKFQEGYIYKEDKMESHLSKSGFVSKSSLRNRKFKEERNNINHYISTVKRRNSRRVSERDGSNEKAFSYLIELEKIKQESFQKVLGHIISGCFEMVKFVHSEDTNKSLGMLEFMKSYYDSHKKDK